MMRPMLAGLLGLAVVLAGTIALELNGVVADDDAMIPTNSRPPAARAEPTATPSAVRPAPGERGVERGVDSRQAVVDGVLARPLFAATRRPAATAPTVAPAAAAPANLPRLAGVLVNGGSRRAIFAEPGGGKPIVLQEGSQVGAYTVQAIEAGQVTLMGPAGVQVVRPSFDTRAPGQAAAPPPFTAAAGTAPFAAANDVMPSLRGLPGFTGAAR